MSTPAQVTNSLAAIGPAVWGLPETAQSTVIKAAYGQMMYLCNTTRATTSTPTEAKAKVLKVASNRPGRPRKSPAPTSPRTAAPKSSAPATGSSTEAVLSKIGTNGTTMQNLKTRLPNIKPNIIGRILATAKRRGEVTQTDDTYHLASTSGQQQTAA